MTAATLTGLPNCLDDLSFSERMRAAAAVARSHAGDPALPRTIDALLAAGAHEGMLAVVMALAVRDRPRLAAAIGHSSLLVRRAAIDAMLRTEPVPEDSLTLPALVHALPPALRRALLKAIVRGGRRSVGRALFAEVLERHGPREAAVLMPVLEDSTLRAQLPALAHAVGSWRSLYLRHPAIVIDHLEARLAEAAPRDQPRVWQQHHALLGALAELHAAALFDLLDRFGETCPVHLLWSRLGELARADGERLVTLLERPRLRDMAGRAGLPRRLLNQIRRFTLAQRGRLARLLGERPELLAQLLKVVAPSQREALMSEACGGQELAQRIWPDVLLDSLPRALQRREAARMRTLAPVRADPDRVLALSAYLDLATAEAALGPALKAADAELRGQAIARLIAAAGREGAMSTTLARLAPRLKNDQDPVRLRAFTALALVPPAVFVAADADSLRALVVAATEARDTSHATRQQIQQLAFRLLRTHAGIAGDALFQAGLDLLVSLAGQTQTLSLPDLSRGLPRRTAPEIVAALGPRIAAANAREQPALVLSLATALGRRAHGLQALTDLLEPLRDSKPEHVATRAITLLLSDPRTRDERVRALIAWDRSVIAINPVLMHIHLRRQAWLDPYLDGTAVSGRFRTGRTVFVLGLASGFHRWLPRQQRAFALLLARAGQDKGQANLGRATVIARLARLPTTAVADFDPYLQSAEVPVIEAALGALAWIDAPADALPLLLAHLDGDRARVAMYALPRVARYVDGATLAAALLDLITGPGRKVTVRKEALRLLGEHRSAASVPALQAALERPDLHKDVAIAVGHAARSLLDDPRALEILAWLAASPEPDIARSLLDPRPELLPAPARPGYAALILGLTRHPDLAVRRAATVVIPTWSSGQEDTIAATLVATLLDLAGGDTWSEACAALVEVAADGRAGSAMLRAAAGLADLADNPGPDPHERDLPAYQRLLALCEALCTAEIDRRLTLRSLHASLADALAADLLWPLACALRISAIDLGDPHAAAALIDLAADARADLFVAALVDCLEGQVEDSVARAEPHVLLALAAVMAAGPPVAARLAVVLVAAAGARAAWSAPAVAQLHALRTHTDLRTRHAARQVFSRPEAPASE